ncbi:dihydrolipoyl dehydrogenase [Ectothiorhodospiraceae bacterium WFHF3C12]|nr:dihydrolipoyl dehydrogenase [Ectothiorhodospiraceae bacterium WFHF3C12]
MRRTRLVIIGAGTAGLTALKEAQRYTEDVILINDGPLGTTCARVGCMPSKALLAVAHGLDQRGFLADAGVAGTEDLRVDLPRVLAHVRDLRDQFIAGPIKAFESLGAQSIAGRPRFLDANTLEVGGERIETAATVIATGSSPIVPGPWQAFGDRVLTSDTVFEQPDLGARVAVIGLGAIGCELGQGLAQLGLTVHGFNRGTQLAGLSDPDVSEAMAVALGRHMRVHTGADAEVSESPDGALTVSAGDSAVEVDWVLAALGRRPNLRELGLESLPGAMKSSGEPDLDGQTLRLGELPVYIAGDVNGIRPLMHEAADQGRVAAYHALNPEAECLARRAPVAIVFTEPNGARVGAAFKDLPADVIRGEADFGKQPRALMAGRNAGRLHVYADAAEGRLLGAEMAVPDGEHLAHMLAWVIQQDLTLDDVLQLPFYHPVTAEGLRAALQHARRQLGQGRTMPDLPLCHEAADWALGGD